MKESELQSKNKKWQYVSILDYCDFERGTEPGRKSYNREGLGVPFIRVGNVGAQIQEQIYTTSTNIKLCDESDILLTLDGTPGIVIRGVKGAYSSGIRKVIIKKPQELLKDFVYYALQSDIVQRIIKKYTTGLTIKHASKSLEYIQIPLPPLSIQQKIVYILDTIQDAVGVQEKIIEKTKELKKSLMADLFKYGGPSFRKGRKLKKTEIGEIPEDWEVVRLGEVVEIIMGQSPPSQFYNENKEGLPFLQGKAEFGEIYPNPIRWCTKLLKIAEPNDILISVRAPVGDINFSNQRYCIGRGLAALRCKESLNTEFLFYYLLLDKKRLTNEASGSTFKAIKKEHLKSFKIPLPSLPEQQEIAEILQTIDQKIEIEQKKKELYEELFKTMLNKLMNGEIDIENLNLNQ